MYLRLLNISCFRLFEQISVELGQGINVFWGENASGKTSLLEAVYFLSRAKSFRTSRFRDIVRHGDTALVIATELFDENAANKIHLGVEKQERKKIRIKANGGWVKTSSELVRYLPVLTILPEAARLFSAVPKTRRSWIDWLLFHVKPPFLQYWKNYYRALRNRNMLLRSTRWANKDIAVWEQVMCEQAVHIHQCRSRCLEELEAIMQQDLQQLFFEATLKIRYESGWQTDLSLAEVLHQQRQTDSERGYTQSGVHRADVRFYIQGREASSCLSRGQLKLLGAALVIAQAKQTASGIGQLPIILIDDIDAELDRRSCTLLLSELYRIQAQCFVTTLNTDLLDSTAIEGKKFHVKQGQLIPTC